MTNQQAETRPKLNAPDQPATSRRYVLQVGAAIAAAALATTMIDRQESKAALQLGDVQGESNGSDAGVAGINHADGPGVLGIGENGPAMRAVGCNDVGLRAESETGHAIDAYSQMGRAINAVADEAIAIRATSPNHTAMLGSSTHDHGVRGVSISRSGVRGESSESAGISGESSAGPGVRGQSGSGSGVVGTSDQDAGVFGSSGSVVGVRGYSGEGVGVEGLSPTGVGVDGFSPGMIGVYGHTRIATGVLAEAHDEKGTALQVQGRARFETAGNAIMSARSDSLLVSEPLTTAESHVSVTFMGNPAPSTTSNPAILYVQREPGYGFWVHLTEPVEVDTPISYLVVDPITGGIRRDPGHN